MKPFALAYLAVVAVLSLITFVVYGHDKRRARIDGHRVAEKTLHLLALLGGWPGALIGQRVFHHKTRKVGYRIVLWLCILSHTAMVCALLYLLQRQG